MKKVLFCAAFVAALSMAFVACGKKDNKAAEGEQKECCDKPCAEKFISAFEAAVNAGDFEKAYQISNEAEAKINPEDFTEEQVARIKAAAEKIPQDFILSKMEQEQAAAAAAANAEEEDEEDL